MHIEILMPTPIATMKHADTGFISKLLIKIYFNADFTGKYTVYAGLLTHVRF